MMRKATAVAILLSTLILFVIAIGYSFHRFQIFAWTIVLGIMFISSVYNKLTMPEFSAGTDGHQLRNLHWLQISREKVSRLN